MKQNASSTAVFFRMAVLFLILAQPVQASLLKADETLLFFTVDAYKKPLSEKGNLNKDIWAVPLHAWVYEQEQDSLWRQQLTEQIAGEINVRKNSSEYQRLQSILSMFLVDSQSLKTLNLSINQQPVEFGRSGLNGHIEQTVEIATSDTDISLAVEVNEAVLKKEQQVLANIIRLIPNQGISIISDIDDTIKDSHVLDKKELLRNTFIRPPRPVPSMNLWYQAMLDHYSNGQHSKAYLHYVSASPWQLYPMLKQFLQQYDFPEGSLYLRKFRFKDKSVLEFLKPSREYKIDTITRLCQRYPGREFILIGDSGEHDPEIYGQIGRLFPEQVKMIYIRKVPGSDLSEQRFNQAFLDIAAERWQLFEEWNLVDFSFR